MTKVYDNFIFSSVPMFAGVSKTNKILMLFFNVTFENAARENQSVNNLNG